AFDMAIDLCDRGDYYHANLCLPDLESQCRESIHSDVYDSHVLLPIGPRDQAGGLHSSIAPRLAKTSDSVGSNRSHFSRDRPGSQSEVAPVSPPTTAGNCKTLAFSRHDRSNSPDH